MINREELELLSKAELIDLILKQQEQIHQLTAALQQLQNDFEALKAKFEHNQKPPTTSQNSSQPPSRDFKSNQPKDKRKHRHGPPQGHPKHERQMVATPDRVVILQPHTCSACQTDLSAEPARLVKVNQITELPEAPAQVIEVRQYEVTCPDCHKSQILSPPSGLEMNRSFGDRLQATVVYLRQEQHLSYVRTQATLENLYRVRISPGGIDDIMQRVGQRALEQVEPIENQVRASAVIYSDETTCRVEGNYWWEWVFCTLSAIRHVIRFNRSSDVIWDVMKEARAEVWVSDYYNAQMKAPTQAHQLCLAHQIRNLQSLIDRSPPSLWAITMQILFRYAIHLSHRRNDLSAEAFQAKVDWIEHCLQVLVDQPLQEEAARLLKQRYQNQRQSLLVFLHRTDVEPTNNISERALRHSVVHRKVLCGFRSEWGAQGFAALASIIDTAELQGIHAFAAIQSLFNHPALPLPTGGE
jgi:transposase